MIASAFAREKNAASSVQFRTPEKWKIDQVAAAA
jgi:hypothetical protein